LTRWGRGPRFWLLCGLLGNPLVAMAGNTYQMHEAPYVAPDAPGPDETLVYVLRENSPMGALQKLAIIDNDTVVGVLTPGTFTWFRVPSGQHEIVGYIAPSPMMHYRVLPMPGKTVYLLCKIGYASGLFIEPMEEPAALQLIANSKYTDIALKGQKAKMDYKAYYDNLYR
jgi:hypothetical protein